jgi:hypothetical protein
MSVTNLLAWTAVTLIAFAKVGSFVVAVKRALRPESDGTEQIDSNNSDEDDGGYWPRWAPTPWPIRPKSGAPTKG